MRAKPVVVAAALCLLVASLAGCTDEQGVGPEQGPYVVSGVFEDEATPQDLEEFRTIVRSFDGEAHLTDTQPIQFHATGLTVDACGDLRLKLDDLQYLRAVGECVPQSEADDFDRQPGEEGASANESSGQSSL